MTYKQGAVVKIAKGNKRGTATVSAFKKVWEPRGWRALKEDAPKVTGASRDTSSEVSTNNQKEGAK